MRNIVLTIVSLGACLFVTAKSPGCPFCAVTSQTLSEETEAADAVVLARLVKEPLPAGNEPDALGGFGAVDPDTGSATFEIYEILKGKDHLVGVETIDVVFFGPPEKEKTFLITGIGTGPIDWTTPLPLTETAADYVRQLSGLPSKGADRLAFFQQYLENEDPLLAQDAYDEFARAPFDEVQALADRMDHDQLVAWIEQPEISPTRRRLYLTMLSVCGNEGDLPMLKEMILSDYRTKQPIVEGLVQSGLALGGPVALPLVTEVVKLDERRKKLGLDAMIACYLTLGGPQRLDAIEQRFLEDSQADYTHTYSTITALRFLGEETDVIPRPRLLKSMRLALDHPDFADQVIPDLARWEDWHVMDRLVKMFEDADERSFVRQPIVTYLVVASEQDGDVGTRAAAALDHLEKLDSEAVERARSMMAFGFLARARPSGDDAGTESTEQTASADTEAATDDPQNSDATTPPQHVADATNGKNDKNTAAISPGATERPADDPAAADHRADEVAAKATAASQHAAAATPLTETDQLTAPNTVMIVGVPLVAGVLLLGLFWLILRSGAS